MDARRRLVSLVREGWSVASASRELGVSRQTAYLWLGRASEEGLALMSERSRRPHSSPKECDAQFVRQVLDLSLEYPYWGARKLHALLWPGGSAPICARTVGRILERHGHTVSGKCAVQEVQRFERAASNELWQADFKKLGPRKTQVETLNALDDATRFCLISEVVPNQTLEAVWNALWEAFGAYGLPQAMLTDNGPAFRNNATWRWSTFDLRLMLLGIRPCHGKALPSPNPRQGRTVPRNPSARTRTGLPRSPRPHRLSNPLQLGSSPRGSRHENSRNALRALKAQETQPNA